MSQKIDPNALKEESENEEGEGSDSQYYEQYPNALYKIATFNTKWLLHHKATRLHYETAFSKFFRSYALDAILLQEVMKATGPVNGGSGSCIFDFHFFFDSTCGTLTVLGHHLLGRRKPITALMSNGFRISKQQC